MNFLEKLDLLMEERSINRSTLSKLSGVPYTTIDGFYKKGYENTKLSTIRKISEALDISLDYLIDEGDAVSQMKTKTASLYSEEAKKIANIYDNELDKWGRQAVRELVETEAQRCKDETQLKESPLKEEPKIINLYVEPSAAGIATPTMGRDYESYTLGPDDPPGAAYAVRLQGDSMEPYYPDGSIVFINHDALRDGEVGIFCVDGGTVCKQYHKEGPIVYLFSLNRKRSDADVVLMPSSNRPFYCQGRVMGQRRYPVPGR